MRVRVRVSGVPAWTLKAGGMVRVRVRVRVPAWTLKAGVVVRVRVRVSVLLTLKALVGWLGWGGLG